MYPKNSRNKKFGKIEKKTKKNMQDNKLTNVELRHYCLTKTVQLKNK